MAFVRDVLSEKGRFDFTTGSGEVLEAYVKQIEIADDLRERVLAIFESVSAELALITRFQVPLAQPFSLYPYMEPDLSGMGILVSGPIAILTTQWFQCNPTGSDCATHFDALLKKRDDYLLQNWTYVTLFVGDAAKAAVISRDANIRDSYRAFNDFARSFVQNQEPWMRSITNNQYVERVYIPLTFARLALWRMRLTAIYYETADIDLKELQSSLEEILLKSKG